MRNNLAEQLLVRIMDWSHEEIFREIPFLLSLSEFKYNDYQQFSPGIRFIESLVRWLQQFEKVDRSIAYQFIKSQLIFISSDQISYLVKIAFPEKINKILLKKTADELQIKDYLVNNIINSKEYKSNLRKSLFISLSDGSRIDQLRRYNGLDNEQVSTTYEISKEKIEDLIKNLQLTYKNSKFSTIFLIDDFTGSGKSYIRLEERKGKILKFITKIKEDKFNDLINIPNFEIHILFYIATQIAIDTISSNIKDWMEYEKYPFNYTINAIQILEDNLKDDLINQNDFIDMIKKVDYFDYNIIDSHYSKGKINSPYLGFDECGLPLVLYHNTPNNSLPILWLPDDKKFKGLFPRVTRHKDD